MLTEIFKFFVNTKSSTIKVNNNIILKNFHHQYTKKHVRTGSLYAEVIVVFQILSDTCCYSMDLRVSQ